MFTTQAPIEMYLVELKRIAWCLRSLWLELLSLYMETGSRNKRATCF